MHPSQVGEFGLIARFAAVLGDRSPSRLELGIGDDAAAWLPAPGRIVVATTDALVEDVHFSLSTSGWQDLGWKALAENISDIAAMGCEPRFALVALALPSDTAVADAEALYAGLADCARIFDCAIVGGDTVRGRDVMITITVIGESLAVDAEHPRPLLERSAARPGDLLAVTGPLGGSAAGLRLLTGVAGAFEEDDALVRVHRRPEPQVVAGLALVEAGVRCALDVSDGLVADVGHICERSGVDAEIDEERIPLFAEAGARFGADALGMALDGGEDYELVCAADERVLQRAGQLLVERGQRPLITIGRLSMPIGNAPVVRLRRSDRTLRELASGGWDHFATTPGAH